MIHRVYQVIKRDGCALSFELSKIIEAINEAYQDEQKLKHEIEEFMRRNPDIEAEILYYAILESMRARYKQAKKRRIRFVSVYNFVIVALWFKRNAYAGRSNTSAVSDMMLLTIPTPPTAVAAIGSLRRGGVICADVG